MIFDPHPSSWPRNLLILPIVICLGACGACRSQPVSPPDVESSSPEMDHPISEELVDAELNTVGWDRLAQAPVVLLRVPELDGVLPIWIGTAEARAIQMELLDMRPPRPMTHDLTVQLLELTQATLESVIVHELREGTYFGLLQMRLEDKETPRWVDTRPSDGLALAVRTGARIQVARRLLEQIPNFDFQGPDSPDQVVQLLGFKAVAVQEELRKEFELPDRTGVVVIEVRPPASTQGLQRGDLIVTAQGQTIEEPLDLLEVIAEVPNGEPLRLLCWRQGEELTIELTLAPPVDPSKKRTA